MGLLKAGIGALSGVLADSWRDYFYCESLAADVLAAKGEKRASGRGSNVSGEANIISDGSIVNVSDGQCMMIVESGAVVEGCAGAGVAIGEAAARPGVGLGVFFFNDTATTEIYT